MAALCFLVIPLSSQAVLINQGDSFRFGIDLSAATPSGPYNYVAWWVGTESSDMFDPGDIMSVYLYDDADPANALGSGAFNWTNGWTAVNGVGSMLATNPAFDGTGFLMFSMVSGSIDLSSGAVFGINNGTTTSGLTDITVLRASAVPEPDTLSLLGVALMLLGAASLKAKCRRNNALNSMFAN